MIQPFLSLIGLICRITSLPCHVVYAIASVFLGTALLATAWQFCRVLFPRKSESFWAWMFLTFTGGANSLLLVKHLLVGGYLIDGPYQPMVVDTNNLFNVLVGVPFRASFYILIFKSWTMILQMRLVVERSEELDCGLSLPCPTDAEHKPDHTSVKRNRRSLLLAGSLLLIVGFCHAYDAPYLILSLVVWTGLNIFFSQTSTRRERYRDGFFLLLCTVPWLIPPIVHALYVVTIHPVGRTIAEIPQPTPGLIPFLWWIHGLSSIGIILWLGFEVFQSPLRRERSRFLFAMFVAAVLLRSLPAHYAGRLAEPFDYIALLMGISGWFRLLRCRVFSKMLFSERRRNTFFCVLFLISIPITVFCYAQRYIQIARPSFDRLIYHLQSSEMRMIEWIDRNIESDEAILASRDVSLHIPRLTGCSVYVGHPVLTPDFYLKREFLSLFFDTKFARRDRETFLKKNGIRYVFYGQRERLLGNANLLLSPSFRVVHREGDTYLLEFADR